MKRFLVIACLGIMLAGVGSSCAQPRVLLGGGVGFGRPVPQARYFYGPRPGGFVRPPLYIAPRPNAFAHRQWGRGRGWRRGW